LEKLVADCKKGNIDRVYITLPMRAEKRIKWLMNELADSTASVYLVPDIFMFELLHARSDIIAGIPTISIYDSPLDGSNGIVKRIEDLVLSAIILLLISPILLVMSFAIKITSRGPILFKQIRYGIDGKAIEIWKFRSMIVLDNDKKFSQAKKNDVRLTPIGGFIRSTSLDELPQFFNVLQGRMSIVGPRPHAVVHNEQYRSLINGYMLRHKVKPGITGWAQVHGLRGETDTLEKMEKRIEFDLDYIRNWSLGFDIKIVVSTILKSFTDKNAY
jgi:putative colanic acid biosynthesis UDP-glucose lipid carrier transferase